MKLAWPLGLYRVSGDSMLPTYSPGDLLLGERWSRPTSGSVVVARLDRAVIKRVWRIEPDGRLWLQGDNLAASTDSRQFGAVERDMVEAVIMRKLF